MKLYEWQKEMVEEEGNVSIRGGRQSGKSLGVARRIAHWARQTPGGQTLIIAASERQENFIYERVIELLEGETKGRVTLTKCTLINNHKILKYPVGQTGKYLEGLPSVDFLYADEAIHIGEKVWDSILPMLLEPRKRGLGWITLLSSTRGPLGGYFHKSFSRKDFKKYHVRAEDQEHTSKEFLEEEKQRLGERLYNVIYNGEFDETASLYLPVDMIEAAVQLPFFTKVNINPSHNYYLGIDPARYGKSLAAFAEAEQIGNLIRVVYQEQHPQTNLIELGKITLQLQRQFQNRKILIDDGGFGAGLIDYLMEIPFIRRKIRAINNASSGREGKILKEDLYSNLFNVLCQRRLHLLNDKTIIESLKNIQFTGPPGEEKIIGNDLSEAIARAVWGATKEKYIKPTILGF